MKSDFLAWKRAPIVRRSAQIGAMFCVVMFVAAPARAAFHLWNFAQLYTNSSGTLQFIELTTTQANQNFLTGATLKVTSGASSNQITLATDLNNSVSTANKTFIFGTAGLHAAGGPTPDYIIPSNFLFASGGTLTLSTPSLAVTPLTYTALPTNGTSARTSAGTNVVNSPTNFAGVTGTVPEPASLLLLGSGAALLFLGVRRREAKRLPSERIA